MKKLVALGLVTLFVTGCACTPKEVYVTVKVPVPVPCKPTKVEEPAFPLQEATTLEEFGIKLKKALAEIEIRKGYETKLKAAVESCE